MSRYHTEKDQDGRAKRFGKGYSRVVKAQKRAATEATAAHEAWIKEKSE